MIMKEVYLMRVKIKSLFGPYYPMLRFFLAILVLLSLSRIGLLFVKPNRISSLQDVLQILFNGFRIDIVTAVYSIAIPTVLAPFFEGYRYTKTFWAFFLSLWFGLLLSFLVLMESVTPTYIMEYDVRPNRLFVEYLIYPKEILSMLWKGYFFQSLIVIIMTSAAGYAGFSFAKKCSKTPSTWHPALKFALLPIFFALIFAGARSSLGHRGINPSNVAFSTDALLNDLTLNSSYSLLYAVYRMKDETDASTIYGKMDPQKMIEIVQKTTGCEKSAFIQNDIPTMRYLSASQQSGEKYNLVIILEESLGAEFVESLDGLPLTPNLKKLSKEGLWFNRLYATGTRSVRGIEALITGFLPTPGRSVVKLGKSQHNFFSIASLLSSNGYHTQFIYGGESNFDNMKGFFLGNGFQQVIDLQDYDNPNFKSTWGVSDGDLFKKAHDFFSQQKDSPFFSLVFTSSNHAPFEFPDNEIDHYEQPKNTVHNAVKYADKALADFFALAKKSNYWNNTVFLVVADHNSRVYGNKLVPVERFRIPGLIIGPNIKPGIYDEIASQIDLPPTLLSMIGISGYVPMIGRDLTQKAKDLPGRAILQFYKNQAYLTGDQLIVLQPGNKIDQFRYDQETLFPVKTDATLAETALAHALWASWTYRNQLYPSHEKSWSHFQNHPKTKKTGRYKTARQSQQKTSSSNALLFVSLLIGLIQRS
ncbi:MAG: LTA synthase family protein [Pseudomonadota bacterium]